MPGKKSIFGKSIELEDLEKEEATKKPSGENAALVQRLKDAYALIFNTLQDSKVVKSRGDFSSLDKLRRDLYDPSLKCKAVAEDLADFLGSFGESEEPKQYSSKSASKPEPKEEPAGKYEHRRYLKR